MSRRGALVSELDSAVMLGSAIPETQSNVHYPAPGLCRHALRLCVMRYDLTRRFGQFYHTVLTTSVHDQYFCQV